MALNLVQHRGEPSIWDTCGGQQAWDTERWIAAAAAGVLVAQGFRRRSLAGMLLTLGGSGLAWWAAAGQDERRVRRGRLQARLPSRGRRGPDVVTEAAEESFPASDAPSWTSTTGSPSTGGSRLRR